MTSASEKEAPVFLAPGTDEWVTKGAKSNETLSRPTATQPTMGASVRNNTGEQGVDRGILNVIGNVRQILRATMTSAPTSAWTTTQRLDILHTSGAEEHYFVRIFEGNEEGEMAARGGFEAARILGERDASIIPRCVGWGKMLNNGGQGGGRCFIVSKFYELVPVCPEPEVLAMKLARMHEAREGEEGRGGRFGFGTGTFVGSVRQQVGWCDDWEEFFGGKLSAAVEACRKNVAFGWESVSEMLPVVLERVVPRLLRPLESHGRAIRSVFLVGNFRTAWEVEGDLDDIVVLEPAGFWGHNEYELGAWKRPEEPPLHGRNVLLDQSNADAYHKIIPRSEPTEDYEDRMVLYSALHNLYIAGNFPNLEHPLRHVLGEFQKLVTKYPDGFARSASIFLPTGQSGAKMAGCLDTTPKPYSERDQVKLNPSSTQDRDGKEVKMNAIQSPDQKRGEGDDQDTTRPMPCAVVCLTCLALVIFMWSIATLLAICGNWAYEWGTDERRMKRRGMEEVASTVNGLKNASGETCGRNEGTWLLATVEEEAAEEGRGGYGGAGDRGREQKAGESEDGSGNDERSAFSPWLGWWLGRALEEWLADESNSDSDDSCDSSDSD
ncbi:hypothetical protein MKZ38_004141 [Zalerion maritima]|uniref:Protein-ribulosamine 3-kinase n=1 Tax=Zalerion maritima TaxID=339359 RepID=A0AAD5RLQ0_9PEZI|nr:hypothetical protein MKZ38_004141 [Zalerion maritima]